MALEPPLWSAGPEGSEFQHSALYDRRFADLIFEQQGVKSLTTDFVVSQRAAGANMTVDVSPGICVIDGTNIDYQGKYICRSTAIESLPVGSAPASGSRTDIVIARVFDSEVTTTQDGFFLEIIEDTDLEGVPNDAVLLASINVASGVSSITNAAITDHRQPCLIEKSLLESAAVPVGGIIMWSGLIPNIPTNWQICDGTNGTPNLLDRFVVGAGDLYSVGDTGGAKEVTLTAAQMPVHNHAAGTLATVSSGTHGHESRNRAVYQGGGGFGAVTPTSNFDGHNTSAINSNGAHTHNISGHAAINGGGSAHENRPPYFALAYIMRIS